MWYFKLKKFSNLLRFIFITIVFISCSKEVELVKNTSLSFLPIAHAGGAIDEKFYTNSLEALENSYKNGCRYFELDIQETSDNQLVAVHNWKEFKFITNYKGSDTSDSPMTLDEVKNSKIYGEYTPLTMDMINQWFKSHKDAILVTDKLNDPNKLINKKYGFNFSERCIMELFSWESLKRANELNIASMASANVVFDFEKEQSRLKRFWKKKNIDNRLNNLGIKYIAIPHSKVSQYPDIIRLIRAKGIKVCVYHVNDIKGNNEEIIYNKYFKDNMIDGMYIDDITFLKINNSVN